jgi:hypothetical protein
MLVEVQGYLVNPKEIRALSPLNSTKYTPDQEKYKISFAIYLNSQTIWIANDDYDPKKGEAIEKAYIKLKEVLLALYKGAEYELTVSDKAILSDLCWEALGHTEICSSSELDKLREKLK